MNRREFLKRFVVASVFVAVSATGVYEVLDRLNAAQQQAIPPQQTLVQSTQSQGATSQIQAPAGYVFVTAIGALAGTSSSYFHHPNYGTSLLINAGGQWKAFSATCTHQPCTVQYGGSDIRCPCHGATFSTGDGSVLGGPAPRPLPEFGVQVDGKGNLFVSVSTIN